MQNKMTKFEKFAILFLSLIVICLCLITALLTVEFVLNPAVRLMIIGNILSDSVNQNSIIINSTPAATQDMITIDIFPTD